MVRQRDVGIELQPETPERVPRSMAAAPWLFNVFCAPSTLLGNSDGHRAMFPHWGGGMAPVDPEQGGGAGESITARVEKAAARLSLSIDTDSERARSIVWDHDESELMKLWSETEREFIEERTFFNDGVVFFLVVTVLIPAFCSVMCVALSVPLMCAKERGGHAHVRGTYMYLMSNLAGLPKSRSGWHPVNQVQRAITMAVTVVGYVLIAGVTGLASQLPVVTRTVHRINKAETGWGMSLVISSHILTTSLYILALPVGLNALVLMVASGEKNGLDYRKAYLYMFSTVVGLTDPLTEAQPRTFLLEWLAAFGTFQNLGIVGAVIGIVSELTAVRRGMKRVTQIAAKRILDAESRVLEKIEQERIATRHLDIEGKHTLAETVLLHRGAKDDQLDSLLQKKYADADVDPDDAPPPPPPDARAESKHADDSPRRERLSASFALAHVAPGTP